jgi:hypothetical protein
MDADARIAAGVAALRNTGFTGCICLHCAARYPDAATARRAVLTAQGWLGISPTDSDKVTALFLTVSPPTLAALVDSLDQCSDDGARTLAAEHADRLHSGVLDSDCVVCAVVAARLGVVIGAVS